MYNEETKMEYLNQMPMQSAKKVLLTVFNSDLGYEDYFGKDLCNFTEPEILEFFIAWDSIAFESLNTKCSLLRSYTQWCIEHNLSNDNINHYDSITRDNLLSCLNKTKYEQKYITLEELKNVCDNVVNVRDQALCYCIFFGIYGKEGEDLRELTAQCINLETGHIKLLNGREFDVPVWVAKILHDSCETYEYISYNANGNVFEMSLKEDDPTVFKARNNSSVATMAVFKKRISRILSLIGKEMSCPAITAKRLRNSGIVYHLKNYMIENNLNAENMYYEDYTGEIMEKYGLQYPIGLANFNMKYGSFLKK